MKAQRLAIIAVVGLAASFAHASAYERHDLAVDAFVDCRKDVGYVLFFRLKNDGERNVELPEDLLPWAASSFAMDFELKPDEEASIQPAGNMADSWGRISLAPREELFGDIRLSWIFSAREVEAALSRGDATLYWKYSVVVDEKEVPPVDGAIRLWGRSFYEKCKNGL